MLDAKSAENLFVIFFASRSLLELSLVELDMAGFRNSYPTRFEENLFLDYRRICLTKLMAPTML